MKPSEKPKRYPVVPDGGWGWLVVFGSFMIHVLADGVIYSFGLFYYELVKHFGASKAVTSMVVSIMNGTTYCIGPIASALTIRFGCRVVTIVGAICASLGFVLSTFATSIYVLHFTIGICAGFGFGLMYLPAIVIVTSYFEKKRAFATGIAVAGSGIGTAIMSPLIEYFINMLGWKGAMLVIAGFMLACCLFGALFKPLPTTTDCPNSTNNNNSNTVEGGKELLDVKLAVIEDSENEEENYDEDAAAFVQNYLKQPRLSLSTEKEYNPNRLAPPNNGNLAKSLCSVETGKCTSETKQRSQSFSPGFMYRKDIFYSGSLVNIPNYDPSVEKNYTDKKTAKKHECFLFRWFNCSDEIIATFEEMIDLSLMKNLAFLIFSISNFLTSVGYHIPFIYLKERIIELNAASPQDTGFFTSIIGMANTISRLVFGYLSDQPFINRRWLYMASVGCCGLVIMSSSLATNYYMMILFCVLFGITCGTYVSLTSVVLVDLLGLEKLTNAFGLILLFQGAASYVGPPLIGFTYDVYGSYDNGFYIIGAIVLFSGVMLVGIDLAHLFKSPKKLLLF